MRRYAKYKDSGIEWIGEIPEHWVVTKIKYSFQFKTGFTPPTGNSDYYKNGKHIWININDLNRKFVNDSSTKITDKAIIDLNPELIPKGSLLFSFKLSVGKVAFAGDDCFTNEAIFSILPSKQVNLQFFYYSLPKQVLKNANENIYGAKILNQDLIKNAWIIVPNSDEQKIIANFLDRKTAEIDTLIESKKRLLELYQEEKTAIINRAVTKGIDPDAPMKDSGIDWLGEIPEHWITLKLKHVVGLRSGKNIVSDQLKEDEKYPVYGGNGIRGYFYEYTHDGNYVLIGRQGALCGNIQYAKGKFWASEHAVVAHPRTEMSLVFLGELLRVMELNKYSVSAAQPGLAVEKIKNLHIPYPDINEQEKISNHISKHLAIFRRKAETTRKLIALLEEYRESLINEVVTGKLKVYTDETKT